MATPSKDLDLLLIGKTGNGKSATGNSILGRKVFKCIASSTSVTKDIQIDYSKVDDRIIKVVDGPGVGDTDLSDDHALELVMTSVEKAIAANPEGYHAFLLVVRFGGRFTKEDHQTIQLLKGIFGQDCVKKHCILLVTCGDNFDPEENEARSFEDWCYRQSGVFRELVEECNRRVILFDNKTKDISKLAEQRNRLIRIIDSLSVLGVRYTNEHFQMAQRERDRLIVESKEPIIRQETLKETSLIIQQLGDFSLDDPQQQLEKLAVLKNRADALAASVRDQDKSTGALRDILGSIKNIQTCVEEQAKSVQRAMEEGARREKLQEEMRRMQQEQEEHFKQLREEDRRKYEEQLARMKQEDEESRMQLVQISNGARERSNAVQEQYTQVRDQQVAPVIGLVGQFLGHLMTQGLMCLMRIFQEGASNEGQAKGTKGSR